MYAIPPSFAMVLPLVVAALSGWLSQQKMSDTLKAIIDCIVIVAVSALWAVYAHSFSPNLYADFVLLAAYCAALTAGPLQPLYKFAMVHWPSPLGLFQLLLGLFAPKAPAVVNVVNAVPVAKLPLTPASTQPMEPLPSTSPGQQG